MSLARAGRLILILAIATILITPIHARVKVELYMEGTTVGSGTAGTGTISVKAFWGIGSNTNIALGDFNGTLRPLGGTGTGPAIAAVFILTSQAPTSSLTNLHCPSKEIGFSGRILIGNFTGQQVLVFGCLGTGVLVGFAIGSVSFAGALYLGVGKGNVNTVQINNAITVNAPTITGSGTSGVDTLTVRYTMFLADSTPVLPGIGFYNGTSRLTGPVAGVLTIDTATFNPLGCQFSGLDLNSQSSGHAQETVSGNCFPKQPLEVLVGFIQGDAINPLFAGHGVGTLSFGGSLEQLFP